MAEILSLVSSIVQVSSFGITLSATLHDYIETVVEAKERLQRLENEIKFTSSIISQLGAQFEDTNVQTVVSDEAVRLAQEGVAECQAIFQAMEDVVAKIRRSGNAAKWTLYFRATKIQLLVSNLERMKGNLHLLLGTITLGRQIATERPDEATISAQLRRIEELRIEKEQYTQKYLEEKRKYDQLLEKINSTSTLGSYIHMSTAGPSRAIPEPSCRAASGTQEQVITEAEGEGHGLGELASLDTPIRAPSARPCMSSVRDNLLFLSLATSESLGAAGSSVEASGNGASTVDPVTDPGSNPRPTSSLSAASALSSTSHGISLTVPASTTTNRNEQRPRKRDQAARVAKHAAKRTGFALSIALGAALFPITIPLYIYVRSLRKGRQIIASAPITDLPAELLGDDSSDEYAPPAHGSRESLIDLCLGTEEPLSLSNEPIEYHSSMLRAELPGPAELAADARGPSMALVGMATSTRYRTHVE